MKMKNIYIIIGLVSAVILTIAIATVFGTKEKSKKGDGAVPQEFCEIGKEYEHNALNPVSCQCPDGYAFETVSMGWGPCPEKGMSDCPASVVKCVKKN